MPVCLVPYSDCDSGSWFTQAVSCCCKGRIIIGNARLCWARSLWGHCVNAPHLPADRSPDWLLMTFLGHRHAKLFIYSKKFPMQIALSTSYFSSPPACVSAYLSPFLRLPLKRPWYVCGHQQSLWYKNRAAVFVVCAWVCMCACVSVRFMHVTDMGHPWLLLRKWHTPTGYRAQKESSANSKPQFSRPLSWEISELFYAFLSLDHWLYNPLQQYHGYFSITMPDIRLGHIAYV